MNAFWQIYFCISKNIMQPLICSVCLCSTSTSQWSIIFDDVNEVWLKRFASDTTMDGTFVLLPTVDNSRTAFITLTMWRDIYQSANIILTSQMYYLQNHNCKTPSKYQQRSRKGELPSPLISKWLIRKCGMSHCIEDEANGYSPDSN